MAKKFSTGLRNLLLGLKPSKTGTTIAFVSGTKTITDSGLGLNIFQPGDTVLVTGAGQGANNKAVTVVTAQQDGSALTVSESLTDEGAGATVTLALANSRGFKDIFNDCIIEIYSGSQPADADQAETGTKLLRITAGGGAFTPGAAANGLSFQDPAGGIIAKNPGETWVGAGLASGTAGWFRCYSNIYKTGQSATAVRFDGSVGTSGSQLNLSTTNIISGQNTTIDSFQLTFPA
jgi:hypothetical protein